jgi:hypothetical protein
LLSLSEIAAVEVTIGKIKLSVQQTSKRIGQEEKESGKETTQTG